MTNLTEQYRKGELPDGFYWCDVDIYEDGNITKQIESFIHHHPVFYWETSIVRVIELAPSFEEWQTAKKMIAQSIGVCDENSKLKEQINHLQKTQARQFRDNQHLQTKAEHAKDVVNIDTARQIKQLKELLKRVDKHFKWVDYDDGFYVNDELWEDIKKVLKEKNNEC